MQRCNWRELCVTRFPHFIPLFLIGLVTFSFSYKYMYGDIIMFKILSPAWAYSTCMLFVFLTDSLS